MAVSSELVHPLERITHIVSSLEGGIHSNSFSKRGKKQAKEIQLFLETASRAEFSSLLDDFARDVLRILESCVLTSYSMEVRCREKSCCEFFKQQQSILSEVWRNIHRDMSLGDPDPLWFQTVNRLIFEDMLVTALRRRGLNASSHCSASRRFGTNPQIEQDQANVIRYAAGYVPFKLLKGYKQKKSPESQAIVDCLSDMAIKGDDTSFLAYTSAWIEEVNRGGLFLVNNACYIFFYNLEQEVRKRLGTTINHTFSDKEMVDLIASDENILFHFDVLSCDIPDECQAILLREFIEMWMKIRIHTFTKMLLEEYKHQKQVETKKSKALRESLKQPNKT